MHATEIGMETCAADAGFVNVGNVLAVIVVGRISVSVCLEGVTVNALFASADLLLLPLHVLEMAIVYVMNVNVNLPGQVINVLFHIRQNLYNSRYNI